MHKTLSPTVNTKLIYMSKDFYLPSHSENVRIEASLFPVGNTGGSIPRLTGRRPVPALLNHDGLNQYFSKVTYGLVLLKMKKALPSGIGVIFSFIFSSDILRGRGPAGTSGSSSSSSSSPTLN